MESVALLEELGVATCEETLLDDEAEMELGELEVILVVLAELGAMLLEEDVALLDTAELVEFCNTEALELLDTLLEAWKLKLLLVCAVPVTEA